LWQDVGTDTLPAFYPQPPREKTLAGQPHDPWQSYSPPPAENQDTYAYPQPGGQPAGGVGGVGGAGGQAYARPAPGYPMPGQPIQDQGFQGYGMPQGYATPPDQAAAQWQTAQDMQGQGMQGQGMPVPGMRALPPAGSHGKGFFGSLFDFSFTSFVTPKIIKVIYVLYTIWMIVWALFFLRLGFRYGGATGGFATLIVVDPLFLVLSLGLFRVVLELFMVVHRMQEDLQAIRERADGRG
jgi:uncharacterized membrane protein